MKYRYYNAAIMHSKHPNNAEFLGFRQAGKAIGYFRYSSVSAATCHTHLEMHTDGKVGGSSTDGALHKSEMVKRKSQRGKRAVKTKIRTPERVRI